MKSAKAIEKRILKQSLLKGFATPDYSHSIANVPHSILKGLGAKTSRGLEMDYSIFKGVKNVVLMCADGLGWNQLGNARNLSKLEGFPITSVAPSTTTTALSSLASGLTPQEHGILGFRVFLRELGHVTNMLSFGSSLGFGSFADEGIDPTIFFPFKNIYQRLKPRAKPFAVYRNTYLDSPFSQMVYRGAEKSPFYSLPDMFIRTEQALKKPGRKFIHVYWDMLDTISHAYGTGTRESNTEVKFLDFHVGEFLETLKSGTLFLLTADHGFANSRKPVDLGQHKKLVELLEVPITGDARLSFLHRKKGKKEKVRDYFESHFSRKGVLLDSKELLEKGLFGTGKPFPETIHRLGDFTLVAKKDCSFHFPYLDEGMPKGVHGGLSKEEMLVPFLWKRF